MSLAGRNPIFRAARPEDELLLLSARSSLRTEEAQRLTALVNAGPDWIYLIVTAMQHDVLPLLYRSLQSACPEAVPPGTLADLRFQFEANAQRSEQFATELAACREVLEAHGITACGWKGPTLAADSYGSVALRRFGDLDVLVDPGQVRAAREVLATRGYASIEDDAEVVRALRSGQTYNLKLERGGPRIVMELHWRVTSADHSFELGLDTLRAPLRRVRIGERELAALPLEEELLAICQHGSKHLWERLKWVCDVSEFLRAHPEVSPERLRAQASRLGGIRMLHLGVLLAGELLGTPIPEELRSAADKDAPANALARQTCGRLFSGVYRSPSFGEGAGYYLRARERWRDRVPYLCGAVPHYVRRRFVPTNRDYGVVQLPRALHPLYYVIRPVRLFWEHWRGS